MEMQKRTDGQTQENRHRENKQRGKQIEEQTEKDKQRDKQIEGKAKRDRQADTGKDKQRYTQTEEYAETKTGQPDRNNF